MKQILTFLENANTNAMLIIGMLVFGAVLLAPYIPSIAKYIPFLRKVEKNSTTIDKISDVQDEKYPQLNLRHDEIRSLLLFIKEGQERMEKFESNHNLHEIPEIKILVDKIDIKLDSVIATQSKHGERISKIEGKLEK